MKINRICAAPIKPGLSLISFFLFAKQKKKLVAGQARTRLNLWQGDRSVLRRMPKNRASARAGQNIQAV